MNKILSLMGASALLLLSGCGKFVDGYEVSPNNPTKVTPSALMAVIQVQTFMNYSGQIARMSNVFTQHQNGTLEQFEKFAAFNIISGDNDNEWEGMYSTMLDAKTLVNESAVGSRYYQGIGRVLLAMNLGLTTDIWGNVPYSAGLKGIDPTTENLNPAYDNQEQILVSIQGLLDQALLDFAADPDSNIYYPGSDDLIFGGDIDNWTITAHILKARYANRLSKKTNFDPLTVLTNVDNALNAGAGVTTDCRALYSNKGNELNQWYAFLYQDRIGYIQMGKFFVDTLVAMNDPRLPFYATTDENGGYSGTALGDNSTSTSIVGDYFASPDSRSPMVTYVELKFIEAEASFRAGDLVRAADAHNNAIKAHLGQVTGATGYATYEAQYASEGDTTITLDKIMFHKYLAMFTQIEAWTDWRRTGIPSLALTPNAFISEIPRRLPTPLTEINYNSNAPEIRDMTVRMWWDMP